MFLIIQTNLHKFFFKVSKDKTLLKISLCSLGKIEALGVFILDKIYYPLLF